MKALTGLILKALPGVFLILISTGAYYFPVYMSGLPGYDLSKVPSEFYNYYAWTTSGNLFLVAIYSFYLFVFTNSKNYIAKIIFLYMFVAETYTALNHVFNKFYVIDAYDGVEIVVTLLTLGLCCSWFLSRALHVDKSAKFYPDRTYIIKFKPANILGIFNHIANLHGHVGVYQDGEIYKFKKAKGSVITIPIHSRRLESMITEGRISIKEIPENGNIPNLVGKKYRLFRYNCNHLMKDAIGAS